MPWLIVAVTALVVGLMVWANLAGLIPFRDAVDPAAVALEQRLAALEQRLSALAANSNAMAVLEPRIAALEARPRPAPEITDLSPLEDRLAALESSRGESGGGDAMSADLEARIAVLEARPLIEQPTAAPPAVLLLAAAQLRSALAGPGSFDAALAALAAIGGDDNDLVAAVAVLAPHAADGLPTLGQLRDGFPAVADAVLRKPLEPPGDSWVANILARLSGLITVRRVGGAVAGDSSEAVVARAEARLDAGDLAAAIAQLESLDGAAAEAAEAWLALARARTDADNALAVIDARAVAALAGG